MYTLDPVTLNKIERRIISGNVNSSLLLNFLTGLYTAVYVGTAYVHMSNRETSSKGRVVLFTITIQYALCLFLLSIQWYFLDASVVAHGGTRNTIYWSSTGGPLWFQVIIELLFNVLIVVSDALLIWRCYHVWGETVLVVAVPLTFLVIELGLSIAQAVLGASYDPGSSEASVALANRLASSMALVSVTTTIAATFLIGYRIHTVTRQNALHIPRQSPYAHIVTMIVESSATYALVLAVYAIALFVPAFSSVESPLSEFSYYIVPIVSTVSAMAPTIMVSRIALRNHDHNSTPSTPGISRLSRSEDDP